MKKLVWFLSIYVLTSTLVACSGGGTATPTPSVAKSVDTPPTISVVTAK